MRIQRIFLFSFLALLFLGSAPIAALSFYASRVMLRHEIANSLENDAAMLMKQIDMLMFERLQNVYSWSQLDILQEGRIGDIDKRLAQFLENMEQSYPGVYLGLFYLDDANKIVAASDSYLIGSYFRPQADWIQTSVPHGQIVLENLRLEPPYDHAPLSMRASVPDKYSAGEHGRLYGIFDLKHIMQLFDRASRVESGQRYIVLLDADGRAIAGSAEIRSRQMLLKQTFADWGDTKGHGSKIHQGQPLSQAPVLVGYAHSQGYQAYANLGWSLLIIQSTEQAFQSIWRLWWWFGGVFLINSLIAAAIAHWLARRIASPILDLTSWVSNFQILPVSFKSGRADINEVQELSQAFAQLSEDLEQSRQQVIHAAKLAVVGEMAAIMAHEVRTPLSILQTSAQILQADAALTEDGRDMSRIIVEESARLNRLISTLLDCARPRPPDMQALTLEAVIERAIELLSKQAENKSIAIEIVKPEPLTIIEADEELLVQVFLNLMLNAIQMLSVAGRIRVQVIASDATRVQIKVEDNGPGIASDSRQRLFDPFFTTRDTGIGLGLTVTQQIVVAHGGSIAAGRSELGGACFTIFLPRRQTKNLC
jgi:signal transduction histidine kinase